MATWECREPRAKSRKWLIDEADQPGNVIVPRFPGILDEKGGSMKPFRLLNWSVTKKTRDEDSQTLYWTFYHGYWTGGGFPVLSASRLGDDGKIAAIGRWRLPQTVNKWKSYWGGVTTLPADFARRYTGGRTMALGFGGYYSICAACSRGPALVAIARPDPSRGELDVAELLCYPDPATAPRDGDYFYGLGDIWYNAPKGPNEGSWTMDDWCRSGVMIDLPEKHGYLAFVKLANGRIGYDYGAIGAFRRAGETALCLQAPLDTSRPGASSLRPRLPTEVRWVSAGRGLYLWR